MIGSLKTAIYKKFSKPDAENTVSKSITVKDVGDIFDGGLPTEAFEYLLQPPCGRSTEQTISRLIFIKKKSQDALLDYLYHTNVRGVGRVVEASSDDILMVIQSIHGWIASGSFESIALFMKTAETSKLAPEILLAALRTTTHYRESLLGEWVPFYNRVYAELTMRVFDDIEVTLQGLEP